MNPMIRRIVGCSLFVVGTVSGFCALLAYYKFWLGEGVGHEGCLGGFVGGSFLWAMFSTVPAGVFFIAVLIRLMLFGKTGSVDSVRLYVYSGILGLTWPLLFFLFMAL